MTSPSSIRRVKNNTVADALSRISEEHLSNEETQKVLKAVPMIPGDDSI